MEWLPYVISPYLNGFNMIHKASCLCSRVTIHVSGEPINSRYCHCRLCQKATSAPSFARVLFNQADVKLSGPIKRYPSSTELDRLFCSNCGTSIAAWRKNGTVTGVAIALFDNPNIFPPTEHTWVSEKIEWSNLDDELCKHDKSV